MVVEPSYRKFLCLVGHYAENPRTQQASVVAVIRTLFPAKRPRSPAVDVQDVLAIAGQQVRGNQVFVIKTRSNVHGLGDHLAVRIPGKGRSEGQSLSEQNL